MVKKDELKIGNEYYVPNYSGAEKVTLLSVDGNYAEVESKKGKVFYRNLQYLFTDANAANRSKRAWEHGRRKAKRR
ncbi:hypothetical protein AALC75_27435 [Lachnospiraceae bacterium 48-42]